MALRVVSNQSEEKIRRQQSLRQLTRELRRFAANFLRLVSGSGRAPDLLGQMERVSSAIREYAEAHDGKLPPTKAIHGILDDRAAFLEYRPWVKENEETYRARWEANGERRFDDAVAEIIRAGLRMTAANFVDQLTQHSMAQDDFYSALARLEDMRRAKRGRYRAPQK